MRDAIRKRMSPPDRESVAESPYDRDHHPDPLQRAQPVEKQGPLVPASTKPPEPWAAADKLAAVIQTEG